MIKQTLKPRVAKLPVLAVGLLCLVALCQTTAHADTLTITGSSDTQNPLSSSLSGQVGFIGQPFSNNFNVTATGQTFAFVFGQYTVGPGVALVESGCIDSPCLPITLTGNLTSPVGSLSFNGFFDEAEGAGSRFVLVDWVTGSGPFVFTTVKVAPDHSPSSCSTSSPTTILRLPSFTTKRRASQSRVLLLAEILQFLNPPQCSCLALA